MINAAMMIMMKENYQEEGGGCTISLAKLILEDHIDHDHYYLYNKGIDNEYLINTTRKKDRIEAGLNEQQPFPSSLFVNEQQKISKKRKSQDHF